jgi:hypothetical protein
MPGGYAGYLRADDPLDAYVSSHVVPPPGAKMALNGILF